MKKEPLISIIVPVYNVEKRLDRCIDSLVTQTHRNLEILLIDDGSKDRSGQICDEWAQRDHRIRVIHKPNGGVSSARNMGLEAATGDYIAFVDSDDHVKAEMYDRLVSSALEHQADQACCCLYNDYPSVRQEESHAFDEQVLCDGQIYSELILALVSPDQEGKKANLLQSPCNKLYRREVIAQNGLQFNTELPYAEDWLFNVNFYRHAQRVAFIPDHLYYYDRTTEGSLSKKFRWNGFDHSVKIRSYVKEWFPQLHTEDSFRNLLLHIQSHYLNLYVRTFGYSGFRKYARSLFENQTLKTLYGSSTKVPGQYRFAQRCYQNPESSLCRSAHHCWAMIHVSVNAAKYYIKKLLRK